MQFSGKRKAWRRANYDRACAQIDDGAWEKMTEWHWRRFTQAGEMVDFWPTTDRMTVYWTNKEEGTTEPTVYDGAIERIKRMNILTRNQQQP